MTDLHDLDRGFESEDDKDFDGIVVYAESKDDAAFYNRLIGSGLRRLIRFTAPNGDPDGWFGALTECEAKRKAAREQGLPETRYWCLLDGEEAVRWGETGFELLSAKSLLFRLEDPAADGVIFLNCYEKENLYLLYGSAVEDIRYQLASYDASASKTTASSSSQATLPNYDAASSQRLREPTDQKTTSCRPPAKQFGPHNVWQAMTRALLSAGLHAACKRPEGRKAKFYKPFVAELTLLHRRRGRLFEDAIFSRLGEYRFNLQSGRHKQNDRNDSGVDHNEKTNLSSDGAIRDRLMIDFWREAHYRYCSIQRMSKKTIAQDPFAREWIRLCDGKSLLTWIFAKNPKLWEKTYERQLMENGFGGTFRSALINALLVEPIRMRGPNGYPLPPPVRVRPPPAMHPWSIAKR